MVWVSVYLRSWAIVRYSCTPSSRSEQGHKKIPPDLRGRSAEKLLVEVGALDTRLHLVVQAVAVQAVDVGGDRPVWR